VPPLGANQCRAVPLGRAPLCRTGSRRWPLLRRAHRPDRRSALPIASGCSLDLASISRRRYPAAPSWPPTRRGRPTTPTRCGRFLTTVLPLYQWYWRVTTGWHREHPPRRGRRLLAANHSGAIPHRRRPAQDRHPQGARPQPVDVGGVIWCSECPRSDGSCAAWAMRGADPGETARASEGRAPPGRLPRRGYEGIGKGWANRYRARAVR